MRSVGSFFFFFFGQPLASSLQREQTSVSTAILSCFCLPYFHPLSNWGGFSQHNIQHIIKTPNIWASSIIHPYRLFSVHPSSDLAAKKKKRFQTWRK